MLNKIDNQNILLPRYQANKVAGTAADLIQSISGNALYAKDNFNVRLKKQSNLVNEPQDKLSEKEAQVLAVLQETRSFFKGSRYKSTNKISLKQTVKDKLINRQRLAEVRSCEGIENIVLKAIEKQSANCGELARITYVLLQNTNLRYRLAYYNDVVNHRFEHVVCQVMLEGEIYVVDPWANIFCHNANFKNELEKKLLIWNAQGKKVASGYTEFAINNYIYHQNSSELKHYEITGEDIRNLKLREGLIETPDVFKTKSFLDRLRSVVVKANAV